MPACTVVLPLWVSSKEEGRKKHRQNKCKEVWIQHVYPTRRGEAVKHHPSHTDTPTLAGYLQALWANQTGSFIVPTALMSPAPQHCNSRESPARGHTVPVTQEKRRSKYAAEGRKKNEKYHLSCTLSCCSQNSLQVGLWWGLTLKGTERYWQTWSKQDPSVCTHFIATSTKWDV